MTRSTIREFKPVSKDCQTMKVRRAIDIYQNRGLISLITESIQYMSSILSQTPTQFSRACVQQLSPGELISTRNKWKDVADLVPDNSPTIVDGGAGIEAENSIGSFLNYFDEPTIIAFEPRPKEAEHLRKKYRNSQLTVHQLALGNENTQIKFNISGGSSSALDPKDQSGNPRANIEIQEEIEVEQIRLDNYLEIEPDLMKLDLQGWELKALQGSSELLEKTDVVLTEINFREIYNNSALFSEIDQFLRECGFQLYNFYDVETWSSGEIAWADAIYVNKK